MAAAAAAAPVVRPPDIKELSKQDIEAQRKERMELLKRLTNRDGDEDNAEGAAGGAAQAGADEEQDSEEDEAEMQRMLGFGSFDTTKGKVVEENKHSAAVGAASKHQARKYRQYMNRRGGFNRSLQ